MKSKIIHYLFVGLGLLALLGVVASQASEPGQASALTVSPNTLIPMETPVPTLEYKEDRPRRVSSGGIIIYGLLSKYSPTVFLQTNTWYGKLNDRLVYIYGGIKRDASPDLTRSAVAVDIYDLSGNILPDSAMYVAPVQEGLLTIVDKNNDNLILISEKNKILLFNVISHEFNMPDEGTGQTLMKRNADGGFIVENEQSPFGGLYQISNQWYQEIGGKRLTVFSGITTGTDHHGVLVVTSSQTSPSLSDKTEIYNLPYDGSMESSHLRIFNVLQGKIILAGWRGEKFVFDLSTRKFLSQAEIENLPEEASLKDLEKNLTDSHIPSRTPVLQAYP